MCCVTGSGTIYSAQRYFCMSCILHPYVWLNALHGFSNVHQSCHLKWVWQNASAFEIAVINVYRRLIQAQPGVKTPQKTVFHVMFMLGVQICSHIWDALSSGQHRDLTNTCANKKVFRKYTNVEKRHEGVRGHIRTIWTIGHRMTPFSSPWRISEARYVQKHSFGEKTETVVQLFRVTVH